MKDLRRIAGGDPQFPKTVFVFMGGSDDGEAFLQPLWPNARGLADPEKILYEAFRVRQGGVAEMFGPGAVACGIRAAVKGNFIGRKQGDPWTLPAFLLVAGDRVLWRHDGRHAGDHPDWNVIAQAAST